MPVAWPAGFDTATTIRTFVFAGAFRYVIA